MICFDWSINSRNFNTYFVPINSVQKLSLEHITRALKFQTNKEKFSLI
jgi:hypothetical protein